MNLARAIGPAVGGVIVAAAGPGWVFALNALSFLGIAAVLTRWRPAHVDEAGSREHLLAALRAGSRYVRNALILRRLLYRALLFLPAASAMWALLPLVAARNLDFGSAGYGLLLTAVGAGAVAGALVMPRLRDRLGTPTLVTTAMLVSAAATAAVATVPNAVLVGLALVPVGGAWIAVLSSLNSSLQLALPGWVRARGLAHYLLVFQGSQAGAGVIWGLIAHQTTVSTALLLAAAALALGALAGLRTPVPDTADLDHAPSPHWPAPQLTPLPTPTDGPVLVTLTYRVPEESASAFTAAMQPVARSRRRTGALRWELYRDGADPTRFVESYLVATWAEHLHQHDRRQTGTDRAIEEQARRHAQGRPDVHHLLPPP
jgi:MFS family permease